MPKISHPFKFTDLKLNSEISNFKLFVALGQQLIESTIGIRENNYGFSERVRAPQTANLPLEIYTRKYSSTLTPNNTVLWHLLSLLK